MTLRHDPLLRYGGVTPLFDRAAFVDVKFFDLVFIFMLSAMPAARFASVHLGDSFSLHTQRFEAGDDVEEFLVDATLAQLVEGAVEILQQFVDVFIGAFHRRQAARVLAGEGFGARPEE
jgi:hypothetical protein